MWPKRNGFSGESTVDLSADLDMVDAQLTPAGDVKLTQRLSCAVEGEFGFQTSVVTQVTSGGVARGFNDASAGMECGAPQTFTTLVPSSSVRFERGEAVIESAFAVCEEGCTRASDTAVVKLRECAPSRATGRMKAHGKGKVRAVPASADVAEPPRRGARRRTA